MFWSRGGVENNRNHQQEKTLYISQHFLTILATIVTTIDSASQSKTRQIIYVAKFSKAIQGALQRNAMKQNVKFQSKEKRGEKNGKLESVRIINRSTSIE